MSARVELERSVAACLLIANGRNVDHIDLPTEEFISDVCRAVIGCAKENRVVDAVMAKKWAVSNGINVSVADVALLINEVPTPKNFTHYYTQLKTSIYHEEVAKLKKELLFDLKTGSDLISLARLIDLKESEFATKYLEQELDDDMLQASAELINRIEKGLDNDKLVCTGVRMLDEMFGGGLLPNELVIVAARPSVGKTAFALQLAIDCQQPVAFFSLEMDKMQIAPRLLSAISLLNTKKATRTPSALVPSERQEYLSAAGALMAASTRIKVIDNPDQTVQSIRREARRQVEEGAKIIIIDYLQLLENKAESRQVAVSEISRGLKNMSKELNVPVICLAQMNRSIESEKRLPRLSDLRESGAIEQDANAVLFIHKLGEISNAKKQVAFILAKGRDVGESFRKAVFNTEHQRFYPEQGGEYGNY